MVTMRTTRRLETLGNGDWVSQTSRVEALDIDRQTLEQERGFSRISRRLGQVTSDLCQKLLSLFICLFIHSLTLVN